jgi:hypothetical protein
MGGKQDWLPLARLARIRTSSEAAEHLAINALAQGPSEWRASEPGAQTIELRLNIARTIRRIRVVIVDADEERSQEFTVEWTSRRGERFGVAVRQQFNFSPRGATTEVEEYEVDLPAVTSIALRIVPDIRGGGAVARVREFALA